MNDSYFAPIFICSILLLCGCLFIWQGYQQEKKNKILRQRIAEAKDEYDQALNGESRVKALEKGRQYFSLLRNDKLSIMDEAQMMNDINARLHLK